MSAVVNVHEAKTHFSKPLNHAYMCEETIVAKAGLPYTRLSKIEDLRPFERMLGGWLEWHR